MWKTAFKKFEVTWSVLGRPDHFKVFKGCLPQILLGSFLNTLTHIILLLRITVFESAKEIPSKTIH